MQPCAPSHLADLGMTVNTLLRYPSRGKSCFDIRLRWHTKDVSRKHSIGLCYRL